VSAKLQDTFHCRLKRIQLTLAARSFIGQRSIVTNQKLKASARYSVRLLAREGGFEESADRKRGKTAALLTAFLTRLQNTLLVTRKIMWLPDGK
jgi:hypothetical protein